MARSICESRINGRFLLYHLEDDTPMTPTDEAKKLVAEALPCKWPDHYCYTFPVHSRECPAHHRPAVESLVTRLLADNERLTELLGRVWKNAETNGTLPVLLLQDIEYAIEKASQS